MIVFKVFGYSIVFIVFIVLITSIIFNWIIVINSYAYILPPDDKLGTFGT